MAIPRAELDASPSSHDPISPPSLALHNVHDSQVRFVDPAGSARGPRQQVPIVRWYPTIILRAIKHSFIHYDDTGLSSVDPAPPMASSVTSFALVSSVFTCRDLSASDGSNTHIDSPSRPHR